MQPEVQRVTLEAIVQADSSRHGVAESDWVALVRAVGRRDQAALRALYDGANRLVYTLSFRRRAAADGRGGHAGRLPRSLAPGAGLRAAGGTVVGWIMNLAAPAP